jgi:hypothetical protein
MTNPPPASRDLAARAWKAFLGLVLMAFGSFFSWWLLATWQKACRMDRWTPTEALVLSSSVGTWQFNEFSSLEFEPRVRYRYEAGGEARESERIRRVPIRSAHRSKAEAWVGRYPAGQRVTAWVDPADPASAVLRRDSKAALYSVWFPALFVAGGGGLVWTALRPPRRR